VPEASNFFDQNRNDFTNLDQAKRGSAILKGADPDSLQKGIEAPKEYNPELEADKYDS
jgi:hypothetical protein